MSELPGEWAILITWTVIELAGLGAVIWMAWDHSRVCKKIEDELRETIAIGHEPLDHSKTAL